jgi:NAD(P)-dependent dehydrogenase (short-subunit alcohol dehydrogenase family)
MAERIALVTGATSGLGRYLAVELAGAGVRVLAHGRDARRTAALVDELRAAGGAAEGHVADLASLADVRRLAAEVADSGVNLLVNNAGVGSAGPHTLTADGHELHFAVNYLAPYLLTTELLPTLRANAPARVVNVGSLGQSSLDFDDLAMVRHYDGTTAYSRSKLALAMFTFDLAEALPAEEVSVVCLHPATYMNTAMVRAAGVRPWNTVEHGGRATMRVLLDPELTALSGVFFDEDRLARAHADAYDPALRARLRAATEAALADPAAH